MIGILQLEDRQQTENRWRFSSSPTANERNEANNESSTSHSDLMGSKVDDRKRERRKAQYDYSSTVL